MTRKRTVDFDFALKKGVITQDASGMRMLSLGQNEVGVCVFSLYTQGLYSLYLLLIQKPVKAIYLTSMSLSLIGIGIAICLMMVFFFYIGVYYPRKVDGARDPSIKRKFVLPLLSLNAKNPKSPPMKLKVAEKDKLKEKLTMPVAQKLKERNQRKKAPSIKKKGKRGKIGGVKKKPKSKKDRLKQVTSCSKWEIRARSQENKAARAKSPKVDPTKVGLLGVFGKGGVKKTLDKAYSGAGRIEWFSR